MANIDDLRNEISLEAAGGTAFEIEAFAFVYVRRLEEAEQVFDLNVELLKCKGRRGRQLELLGYAEDLLDGSLTILAGRYFGEDQTLRRSDVGDIAGRAVGFIEHALDGWIEANLDFASRESECATYFKDLISRGSVSRIRLIIITDGVMSDRIRTIESIYVEGLKVSYEIWDQRRLLDSALPERGSEDIHVDFTHWLPRGLPCLVAEKAGASTQTYLAAVPGKVLAEVFDEYGSLLLESNVRTFLSARGPVNRDIQATLLQEPERFLAYNNGLTTTATSLEVVTDANGSFIQSIDRWQIVNGGQTTASIAHFLRSDKKRNVDDVWIQLKLVIVSDNNSSEIVQNVARYANRQNRVSGADFFATHEVHVRLQQISRRLRAPAREGEQFQSGWYYERARGQWENDRAARGSIAAQKKFELEYPKSQRITKTDWAKYEYCWDKKPHLVSKGVQTVFADYANVVNKLWEQNDSQFGEDYFRSNIGKAILYESFRAAVQRQDWYRLAPGYLANIVAYSISRFALQVDKQFPGKKFDFGRIWQNQSISAATLKSLLEVARVAQQALTAVDRPQANVTQWAKQPACWDRLSRMAVRLASGVEADLEGAAEAQTRERDQKKQQAMDSGFGSILRVLNVDSEVWGVALTSTDMSPVERSLLQLFGAGKGKVPSERQAETLLRLLNRLADNGLIKRDAF